MGAENTAESSADHGGQACEVSEGRKPLPGLFAFSVLFAGAEELKETRTIKMKQLAFWGL